MISFINDPNELKGRRALVTGGSRGIGAAIVRRVLSVGARVVAVARNPVEDFPADAVRIQWDDLRELTATVRRAVMPTCSGASSVPGPSSKQVSSLRI